MDATRTINAHLESSATRVDKRVREAQAHLAARSFDTFVRQHNATVKGQS